MIEGFKTAIKESLLLKGFLGILMLSFAIWGVGDAINPAIDPNIVIKVDQVEVRATELQRRFNSEVDQLRQAIGPEFTAQDAVDMGIMNQIIAQLSDRARLDMAARQMGVGLPDATLRRAVLQQEMFKDETGNFSRILLNSLLASNNLTEQEFVDLVRSDVLRQVLLQPVASNTGAPDIMVNALFRYRAEQRIADVIYIADENVEIGEEPGEDTLRQIYNDNLDSFTAPEYREVEAIVIKPRDLVPPESITEEEIQTFYDENIDRYREQPTRTVRQLVFGTQEDAEAALSQLEDGDTLVELGERTGMGDPIDLGELKANDNIGLDLGPVFARTETGITEPVPSDFGWHLFEVTALTNGSISALPVVRDQIIDFIVSDRAFDEIYEATIYLEDQLAAGVPMSEIAGTPGYTRLYFETMDRDGRDSTGARLDFPVDQERFIRLAFSTQPGIDSQLVETEDYAYILRVNAIIDPAPRPYERVAADVRALWEEQTRSAATLAKAESVRDDIGPSVNLADLAEDDEALEFAKLGPITRFGDSLITGAIIPARLISPALLEDMFQNNIGDVIVAKVANGHVVGRLIEILPPDTNDLADVREQVAGAVSSSLANDLVAGFTDSITQQFDVVLNREAIDELTPQ